MADAEIHETLEQVAYHEAGHAVMAIREGLQVEFVAVYEEPRLKGVCRPVDRTEILLRDPRTLAKGVAAGKVSNKEIAGMILTLLAGGLAEQRFLGSAEDGGGKDLQVARTLTLAFADTAAARFELLAWLAVLVKQDLAEPSVWHQVQRVAAALLERRTLTDEQVRGAMVG